MRFLPSLQQEWHGLQTQPGWGGDAAWGSSSQPAPVQAHLVAMGQAWRWDVAVQESRVRLCFVFKRSVTSVAIGQEAVWQRGGGVTGQLELPPPLWMISMGGQPVPEHCAPYQHTVVLQRACVPSSRRGALFIPTRLTVGRHHTPETCGWHGRAQGWGWHVPLPTQVLAGTAGVLHGGHRGALTQHSAELTGLPALRPSLGGREPAHLQDMGAGGEQEGKLQQRVVQPYPGAAVAAVLIPPGGAQVLPVSAALTGEV